MNRRSALPAVGERSPGGPRSPCSGCSSSPPSIPSNSPWAPPPRPPRRSPPGRPAGRWATGVVPGLAAVLTGTASRRPVDEHALHGRAREPKGVAVLYGAGALGLAGLPPFGTALGKSITEEAVGPALAVL